MAKQAGGDQNPLLEDLELLVPGEPLLLAHAPVDGDGREVLLNQQLGQCHAPLHRLDEDHHLVELQHIQELKELAVLLRVLQLDVVLKDSCSVSFASSSMYTSIGSCMNFLHTGLISLERVALNIITCFSWGVARKISCTSRRMSSCSSILSHSSRTKCFRFFSGSFFDRIRARILPGVPTTMCGQLFFKTCSSLAIARPPKNTPTLTAGRNLLNLSYSLLIWNASSLVWHITNTETCPSTGSICWRVARTKTAVLPMPDFAWDKMSMPSTA